MWVGDGVIWQNGIVVGHVVQHEAPLVKTLVTYLVKLQIT